MSYKELVARFKYYLFKYYTHTHTKVTEVLESCKSLMVCPLTFHRRHVIANLHKVALVGQALSLVTFVALVAFVIIYKQYTLTG